MVCTEPFLYRTASIVGEAVGFLHNTNKKSCNTLCVRLATSAPCSNRPMITELLYFHDPMCSWCWAFCPVWTAVCRQLPTELMVRCVVGGLAPDTNEPMPYDMHLKLKGIW